MSEFLRFKVSQMFWGSFFATSQESNLCSLPGETAVNYVSKVYSQVPGCFLKGFLLAFKVNFNSLMLSGDIQVYMSLSSQNNQGIFYLFKNFYWDILHIGN